MISIYVSKEKYVRGAASVYLRMSAVVCVFQFST